MPRVSSLHVSTSPAFKAKQTLFCALSSVFGSDLELEWMKLTFRCRIIYWNLCIISCRSIEAVWECKTEPKSQCLFSKISLPNLLYSYSWFYWNELILLLHFAIIKAMQFMFYFSTNIQLSTNIRTTQKWKISWFLHLLKLNPILFTITVVSNTAKLGVQKF